MINIRTRLAKLEAITPKRQPDGAASERILARLAAMHDGRNGNAIMPEVSFEDIRAMMHDHMAKHRTK